MDNYRDGSLMIAIILIIIIGANMNAIFITKGSKYDCNLKLRFSIPNRSINDWNLSQLGPNMIAMSKIVLRSGHYDFSTNLAKTNFRSLQSYFVLFEKDCNHIWPDWEFTLQS